MRRCVVSLAHGGYTPPNQSVREFYAELFTADDEWSAPYPNTDEARRLAVIVEYLSTIRSAMPSNAEVRILDLGCGRGWLAGLLRVYGVVEGVEPVPEVAKEAQKRYPDLCIHEGTADTLLVAGRSGTYDVVIATEVIEHIPRLGQATFVSAIEKLLRPGGHAIITTPRGDYYRHAKEIGYVRQPVEEWLTEKELRGLFESQSLVALAHRRIYMRYPRLSIWHRLVASYRGEQLAERLRWAWMLEGMRSKLGFYQAWLFQKVDP